ncbi:phytoene/squalene synthetase [Thioflavicoccus mobilis 8321]|uniref:Phytoene/squalene synthetase n=1 Tax=Thioflavicoccus mobilis 8321 TaxID=765912 RepID=L0GWA1_9GAMM|nr:squalene/phytoene synthase family protein [Thioflavicoccus mobilis]AGA91028.1 phytoene/squalene synthetase [Thioflavicoccus mobilis 8321]
MDEWRFPSRATPPGSAAYYSIRFAPSGLRDDLARLLGWRQALAAIPDTVSDPGVAQRKLDWWREEFAQMLSGTPRHPLSRALAPALDRHTLPPAPFLTIAARAEAEIHRRVPADRAAVEAAEEEDRGALFELLARCHGTADSGLLVRARRLGGFCGQVERLRDAGRRLRAGRAVFAQDSLVAAGLAGTTLERPDVRRRLAPLVAAAAAEARDHGVAIDASDLPVCLRIRARLAERLLVELTAPDANVVDTRIALTPLNKLWHAWRESRRRPPVRT